MLTAILRSIVLPAIFLALFLGFACGTSSPPVAPTKVVDRTPTPLPTPTPVPTPTPTFDLSPFVGVWNVDLRFGEGTDVGCTDGSPQFAIGAQQQYSITITNASVTLKSSTGYACTFTDAFKTDANGFTTENMPGKVTCNEPLLVTACKDGTTRRFFCWGQDITASFSHGQISGTWFADWELVPEQRWANSIAQFTGSK